MRSFEWSVVVWVLYAAAHQILDSIFMPIGFDIQYLQPHNGLTFYILGVIGTGLFHKFNKV